MREVYIAVWLIGVLFSLALSGCHISKKMDVNDTNTESNTAAEDQTDSASDTETETVTESAIEDSDFEDTESDVQDTEPYCALMFEKYTIKEPAVGWKVVGTGDIDNDTKVDAVLINSDTHTLAWLANPGPGLSQWPQRIVSEQLEPSEVFATHQLDLNGDEATDIMVIGADGQVAYWQNPIGTDDPWKQVAVANLDMSVSSSVMAQLGDGSLFLLVAGTSGNDSVVMGLWNSNISEDNWIEQNVLDVPSLSVARKPLVSMGDINGDGFADALIAFQHTMDEIEDYWVLFWMDHEQLVNATVKWESLILEIPIFLSGPTIDELLLGDFDSDSDNDVFFVKRYAMLGDECQWVDNLNGDGSQWQQFNFPYTIHNSILVDMDKDEDLDMVGYLYKSIYLIENIYGDGSQWEQCKLGNENIDSDQLFVQDMDADGDEDLVMTNREDGQVLWWEQK